EFIVDVGEETPHLLHGDDTRLKQCVLNILTNAVKYTPEGSVTLSVSAERLAKIAFLSRDTELDPTECAGYFHGNKLGRFACQSSE
ncbi:MAG: hypothetical protein II572_05990, partial [Clostridia bacterium]|nr:hypothetical protein [Clostridia bacterium]